MIKTSSKNTFPIFYIVEAAINLEDIKTEIIRENTIIGADGNKIKTVTADSTLQSFEVINWNTRRYPWAVVMDGMDNNLKIQNDIKMKQFCGEYGHPDSKEMARQSQIMPAQTSHYIDSYRKEGNLLRAHVTSAPYGFGFYMYNTLMAGRPWAFSLRAFGGVDSNNVALKPLTVITYDEVNRPSHKEAYATGKDVINTGDYTDTILRESSLMLEMDASTITQQVTNFILERSDNMKIAKEMFGLEESFATYDGKQHIMLEGNYRGNSIKAYVPIESYVRDYYKDIITG
jgi:hypothetical protein